MQSITTNQIKEVLETVWPVRREVVPCFIGDPGIGKTQCIEEFANEHGADVVHIIASQILPNEVSGITMPVEKTHSMEIYDHARLASLKDGDVLFFDELFEASPQVLSACLTLIQERRMMSGKKLPDVMIVAAANPVSTPSKLKLSVRQRFMFVQVSYDKYDWLVWMQDRYNIKLRDKVTGFINDYDETTYNVRTPRTMTKATLYMQANLDALKDKDSDKGKAAWDYCQAMLGDECAQVIFTSLVKHDNENYKAFVAMRECVRAHGNPDAMTVISFEDPEDQDVYSLARLYKQLSNLDPSIMDELAEALKSIPAESEEEETDKIVPEY